ncbi:hypothetical protein K7X08_007096 [Anisodus acutangulus]|uniref:RNase H type-1 domain-containing protein n=1 Tax=Anisodus acutangulus TaxID=402998 RepID=A0A9Q1LDF9_9SOLA|nr:hypothetical protein K7X08_007096 [Anisodus acutangulus]
MIFGFSESLEYYSNNMAETKTPLLGLQYSSNLGLHNIILEMDSKLMVDMIKGVIKPSWRFQNLIEDIQEWLNKLGGTVQHCYKDTNTIADIMSKQGSIKAINCAFQNPQNLPKEAIGPYRLDKSGMANFRVRKKKARIAK